MAKRWPSTLVKQQAALAVTLLSPFKLMVPQSFSQTVRSVTLHSTNTDTE